MKRVNAPIKGLIISLIVAVAAFGIYFALLSKKNYYVVDNASAKTYYFKINQGSEQIISGGQTVRTNLKKGINQIIVMDDNKKKLLDTSIVVKKDRGLLNISRQPYYINRQYYGYIRNRDSLLLAHPNTLDGKRVFGDFKETRKLYEEDFYFNVDEKYDPIVKNIDKIESRTKIFRKEDFIIYKENEK